RDRRVELPGGRSRRAQRVARCGAPHRRRRAIARFAAATSAPLSPAGFGSHTAVNGRRVASQLQLVGETHAKGSRMPTTALETLSCELLTRPSGGINMRLTQYGYPGDPYSDSETRKGHGAYHSLVRGESVAMTDAGLRGLGLSRAEVRATHP